MKRAKLLVYIFVAGGLLSCTPRASKTGVERFEISLSLVCEDDILLGMPNKLVLSGDIMAISDTKMDSLVHFVNVKDGKYIGKGCAYGQGPNEMSMITSLSPTGGHGYTVYEPNRRTLYRMYPDGAGGWRSLGKQTATDYVLKYDNVPDNALLWLRNYSRGKEERAFYYKGGKQVFP